MKPPFPSLTQEWHNDTYPAIDPKRPELSVKGKRVIVTGGGAGIGRAIAEAFVDAGASALAIIGRRENVLKQAKDEMTAKSTSVEIHTYAADITDLAALKDVAQGFGKWDVLVCNAAVTATPTPIAEADAEQWWKTFEINVKGNLNLVQAFFPTRNSNPAVLSINAGSIQVQQLLPNYSAYNGSKFATLNFMETLAAENPDVHVVTMHPGVVETDLFLKAKMHAPYLDKVELPAHFAVWLVSEQAKFLRGRFVWCNWDVEQLVARKGDFEGSLLATANCIGWPYSP